MSIGLYLPLFFELDVEPLLRLLLRERSDDTKIFVPEIYDACQNAVSPAASPLDQNGKPINRNMRFVQIVNEQDLDTNFLPVPPFSIREPPAEEADPLRSERIRLDFPNECPAQLQQNGCLDILIVPGVAFDHQANRLGKGAGFYDRWIAAASSSHKATLLVGVCFDEQLPCSDENRKSWWKDGDGFDEQGDAVSSLNEVPMESWDRPLDVVVTPSRLIQRDKFGGQHL